MTTTRPRTIAALDVPADVVAAEAACLVLRQAATATHSESDLIAYANDQFLITHPKACSQDEDYPGWAEQIAETEEQNRIYRQVARWNAAHPVGTAVTAYPFVRPEHPVAVDYRKRADAGDLFKSETDPCERLETATRSRAEVLSGHTAVVWVDGHSACIALTHIDIRPGGAS